MSRWVFFVSIFFFQVHVLCLGLWGEDGIRELDQKELFQLANQYFELEDYFSAVEIYQEILSSSPEILEPRYNLAHAYYRIYSTLGSERGEGYLALSIYTYEQILNLVGDTSLFNEIPAYVKTNLNDIRLRYGLNAVFQGPLEIVLSKLKSFQKLFLHGMGVVFLSTVFFSVLLFWNPTKKSQSSIVEKEKKHPQNLLNQFFFYLKTKLYFFFVLSLSTYLLFLGLFVWSQFNFIGISTQPRGVIVSESLLRSLPQANNAPFARIYEGETVFIMEYLESNSKRIWVKIKSAKDEGWIEANRVWTIDNLNLPKLN